jgi:hypothetical protein
MVAGNASVLAADGSLARSDNCVPQPEIQNSAQATMTSVAVMERPVALHDLAHRFGQEMHDVLAHHERHTRL